MKTNEGVVLGVEKKLPSKLMEPAKSEKLVEVSYDCTKALINHILHLNLNRCVRSIVTVLAQ